MTVTTYWRELVTVALLGTDRRDPPSAAPGGIGDVVADSQRPTPSGRMLAAVAACTATRRAGVRPGPPASPLAGPAADPRPMLPPAAADLCRQVVVRWPVLEDEWLMVVGRTGWRLPPDMVVGLLRRHRRDPVRRARALDVAGPLGPWLVEQQPQLAAPSAPRRAAADRPAAARPAAAGRPAAADRPAADDVPDVPDVPDLPELAMPPPLRALLHAPTAAITAAVVGAITSGDVGVAHRAVLVNFVARVRADALEPLAGALAAADPAPPATGLARSLADLAAARAQVLAALEPS